MPRRRTLGLFGLLLATAAVAPGRDDAPAGGTKPGDVIPSTFRSFVVVDDRFVLDEKAPGKKDAKPGERDPRDRTNKIHCLVCENGLSPVVAIFVRGEVGANSGLGRLVQEVNRLIPQYRGDKLAGFVIFLRLQGVAKDFENAVISTTLKNPDDSKTTVEVTYGKAEKVVRLTEPNGTKTQTELGYEYPDDEKRDQYAGEIRDVASGLKAQYVPFGLAPAHSKATEAWGIGDADDVTVVIYNRLRVFRRWTFKGDGPTPEQVKEVTAAVEEMITGTTKKK